MRDGARQQAAGGLGEDGAGGDEDHRDDGVGGVHPDRAGGAALHPGQREAAEQTGGDVVGVALDLGGELQQGRVVEAAVAAYGHGAGGDDAGADGGGGGAEAAAVRDAVGADDLQAARLAAQQVEGGAQGPYEQVALVPRERLAALTRDVDVQSGVGDPDDDVVVETQRQAEGVEARAEVGAGGGDAHPDGGGAERWTGHRSMTLLELRNVGTCDTCGTARRPHGRRHRRAYAPRGFGTAYRRKVLWRHRAHRRRTLRVGSPLCTPYDVGFPPRLPGLPVRRGRGARPRWRRRPAP